MPTDISEKALESLLESTLCNKHGYEKGKSDDYNKDFGFDTERVKRFILATQREKQKTRGALHVRRRNASFSPNCPLNFLKEVFLIYCAKASVTYRSCLICIILCLLNSILQHKNFMGRTSFV